MQILFPLDAVIGQILTGSQATLQPAPGLSLFWQDRSMASDMCPKHVIQRCTFRLRRSKCARKYRYTIVRQTVMNDEISMNLKSIPLGVTLAAMLFLSACSGEVTGAAESRPSSDSSVAAGRLLIENYGCGSCHTIPGIPGAHAVVGPSLDHFYNQMMIAGALPNTDANLIKWIQHPQEIVPGDAMPDMGVTQEQARDIAAYLYHQPTIADWFGQ